MTQSQRRVLGGVLAILLTSMAHGWAAPITLNYNVTVTDRLFYVSSLPDPLDAPIMFGLSVTFDDQLTVSDAFTDDVSFAVALNQFGSPTFSSIPLPTVGVTLETGTPQDGTGTYELRDLGWSSSSSNMTSFSASRYVTDGIGSAAGLSLGRTDSPAHTTFADVVENLTLDSYVQGMTAAPLFFSYYTIKIDSQFNALPGSYVYQGTAEFVPTTVPEPASLSLLALGAFITFAARKRR